MYPAPRTPGRFLSKRARLGPFSCFKRHYSTNPRRCLWTICKTCVKDFTDFLPLLLGIGAGSTSRGDFPGFSAAPLTNSHFPAILPSDNATTGTSSAVFPAKRAPGWWKGERGTAGIPPRAADRTPFGSRLRRARPIQRGSPAGDSVRPRPARGRRTRGGTAAFRPLSRHPAPAENGQGVFLFQKGAKRELYQERNQPIPKHKGE